MALVGKLLSVSVASNKGEAEPERKETRNKVDEDRKHEYPFLQRLHGLWRPLKVWGNVDDMLLYIHRNHRLIRDRSPGRPPQLSHSSWAQSGENGISFSRPWKTENWCIFNMPYILWTLHFEEEENKTDLNFISRLKLPSSASWKPERSYNTMSLSQR